MSNELMVIRHVFEGRALESILVDDVPMFVAKSLGLALGYSDNGGRIVDSIRREWSADFVEGTHYRILTADELAVYKATIGTGHGIRARSSAAMVLTESGVYLAITNSRKAAGTRLRQFFAERVMPSLVRTGRYESPDVSPPTDLQSFEARMDQKLDLFMEKMAGFVGRMIEGAVGALASGRAERMTVEMHDTRITVTNQSPVPDGWVRTWRGGAGLVGVPWTVFKREFEAMESALVPRWAIRYEEPVVTNDRRGMPIAIPRPAIAFHPEIGQEMARLKAGGGPLFS